MKILYQDVVPSQIPDYVSEPHILWDTLEKHAKLVAKPTTEITLSHLDKRVKLETLLYFERVNDILIVNKIIRGEEDGCDAAVIDCFNDSGLHEARQAVAIPVTSVAESSYILAQMLGRKFAIVAMGPRVIPLAELNIKIYGIEDKFIKHKPIRSIDLDYEYLLKYIKGEDERLIVEFERVAKSCIDDGADVIIPGCGYLPPALTIKGYRQVGNTGIPVIDGNAAAIKFAEALVELRKSIGLNKSTYVTSFYRNAPKEELKRIREEFGF
jgi:allantoin racemase